MVLISVSGSDFRIILEQLTRRTFANALVEMMGHPLSEQRNHLGVIAEAPGQLLHS